MTPEEEYGRFLKDKRVMLIGPAKSSGGQVIKDLIDSYDVIVRINDLPERYDGSEPKTDVVYYDGSLNNDRRVSYKTSNLKFIINVYPASEWFYESRIQGNINYMKNNFSQKILTLPEETYGEIKDKIANTRPNSGTCAIIDLLKYEIKELFIIGVDFYRSAYGENSASKEELKSIRNYNKEINEKKDLDFLRELFARGDGPDYHNPDLQFKYFKYSFYLKDSRIKVTDEFKFFLKDAKFEDVFYNNRFKHWHNNKVF